MNKKKSGSYYTPQRLANIVANYCLEKIPSARSFSVIEPSSGDGVFVDAISTSTQIRRFDRIEITAIEKDKIELEKVKGRTVDKRIILKTCNMDYLDFHFLNSKKYDLYIGNPPYVKKNLMDDYQKVLATAIHAEKNLSSNSINNIWTAFLVSAITKLKGNGLLALILPLELLQVKFTEEIRNLLINEFQRVEIFTFNELQFQECKGQDTVLLVGYKRHEAPGTYYTNIDTLQQMEERRFDFYQNQALANSTRKWTHHFISPDDYQFLERLKQQLFTVSHYISNKPGVVTAANSFFIVNENTVNNYGLQKFAKPIVQKGILVNGSLNFSDHDFEVLVAAQKPAFLLDFTEVQRDNIESSLNSYLEIGITKEIPLRYKCRQRVDWYKVPNISTASAGFFFKRAHEYPKLLYNDARVLVTDSAYMIEMKNHWDLRSFIFSFYNSLTLVFAELEGRYYGGGVLELTPNEFRSLPIPYINCADFESYSMHFDGKKSIEDILNAYNFVILNSSLGLTIDEISRIEAIRIKLIQKRQKSNLVAASEENVGEFDDSPVLS